ncbi:hypothetical protein DH2020_019933 [Rehmannia glutinosa]|uniref:Folate-biopterin transporter 1, chloroplastic n=1 Tax=Rehmannia glutinosa TaxID=99300 RepID=A0ABR0WG69_REHGL
MATRTLSPTSFPILPSSNPIFSFLSLSPYLRHFRRKPPSATSTIRSRLRRKPPRDFDMSGSVSLRRDSGSEPLLDSSLRKGDVLATTVDKDTTSSNKASLLKKNILPTLSDFSFYLKDDLHLDPAETAIISGVSSLPWLVKPLYGFISDSFPLFGYRRRSYLVISGLLGALSWSLMATFVDSKYGVAFCILLGSLSVAFSDVVVDSMVVERARGESQSMSGSLQSLCWGSSALGHCKFLLQRLLGGCLWFVFGLTALLPLITSAVAVLVEEQPVVGPTRGHNLLLDSSDFLKSSKRSIMQLWGAVKQPNVLLPTLFIFLWQATPQSDSAMFYFTTNELGFTPEFLGRVKLVTSVASSRMTQVLLVTGLNRQFGISDEWFAIGDSLIITVLGQVFLSAAMQKYVRRAWKLLFSQRSCPYRTVAVFSGFDRAGLTQLFGVTKDEFSNLTSLIILCNLSSLLPLPLLGLLPQNISDVDSKESDDIEMKSN